MGIAPDSLPDDGFEYWADGGVCVVFHNAMWPGVWGAHIAVKPEAWGYAVEPCRRILAAFWAEKSPGRIVAWVADGNRAALAFLGRVGAATDGAFPGVVMKGWTPWV